MDLHVLFVEDNPDDYEQIFGQITDYFNSKDDLEVHIDGKQSFEEAIEAVKNPHIRYDLIISDTYKGEHSNANAAVLELVDDYRGNDKFCPLIVCSSGVCPAELESSAFINWVGKVNPDELDRALADIINIGIPQLARSLHDEIDSAAGIFLWGFLEKNWADLNNEQGFNPESLERLIRSRAAMVLDHLVPGGEEYSSIDNRYGLEYYIYPSLAHEYYNLGDILRNKENAGDIRVILTPHCHLYMDQGRQVPSADYILTLKTVSVKSVLGEQLKNLKEIDDVNKKLSKLSLWARSPSQTKRKPEGRHWYLPHFLKVPHLFCDFLQVESIAYDDLENKFDRIATLIPPYAEAMQQSYASFYGSVGIPDINANSIIDMLD